MDQHAKRKRGRGFNAVRDEQGMVIPLLGATPFEYGPDGKPTRFRYYIQGTKPRKWLGFNLRQAISRLELWKLKSAPERYHMMEVLVPEEENSGFLPPVLVENRLKRSYHYRYDVPESVLWDKLRQPGRSAGLN